MADAFTDTTTLTQATQAYERLAYFALRPELYFDNCADVKPTRQSHPGSSVLFNIYNDLAPAITPLGETTDVTAVSISDSEVTVALNEYGNAAITSARIRGFSYLIVSTDVANVIGFNAGLSFDCLARNPLVAGTNVTFGDGSVGSRVTITSAMNLTAALVRRAGAELANRNSQRVMNGYYKAYLSPLTAIDLRSETGPGNWRDPHVYSQPQEIWNGETGAFESFSFIETPRLSAANLEVAQGGPGGFVNGGAASEDIHPTLFLGRQALAKTWSSAVSRPTPQVVLGAVVDKLQRLVPVGWYWLGGFGRFREDSLWRVETASTLTA